MEGSGSKQDLFWRIWPWLDRSYNQLATTPQVLRNHLLTYMHFSLPDLPLRFVVAVIDLETSAKEIHPQMYDEDVEDQSLKTHRQIFLSISKSISLHDSQEKDYTLVISGPESAFLHTESREILNR